MSALYSQCKQSGDCAVVFVHTQELSAMVGAPDIDYELVRTQIMREHLSECGQGGSYYIYFETIKRIHTGGGYKKYL